MSNVYHDEFRWILKKLDSNMEYFKDKYPSACTTEGIYRIKGNDDWTNGFYIGMYFIAYEYTKDKKYFDYAKSLTHDMMKRMDDHFVVDHHDIGFLVLPSIVAMYNLTSDEIYYDYMIKAADILCDRYHQDAGFIQAWGDMTDSDEYRLIIDSLLNLPLLYFVYTKTLEQKYKLVYETHFDSVVDNIIRDNGSTYHTYYFDTITKAPKDGKTAQGFSDDSCWSRGQAWLLWGSMLNYNARGNQKALEIFLDCEKYIDQKTIDDPIPYWDFIFDKTSNQYHDSSAAIINLLAYQSYYGCDDKKVERIFKELNKKYTSKNISHNQGILTKSMYAYLERKGIAESCLWGDYFYMEFLLKQVTNNKWRGYFDVH